MTAVEKLAIRQLINSLKTISASKPEHLDNPGYKIGFANAAKRATETLEWLLAPNRNMKDLKRYANQSLH